MWFEESSALEMEWFTDNQQYRVRTGAVSLGRHLSLQSGFIIHVPAESLLFHMPEFTFESHNSPKSMAFVRFVSSSSTCTPPP